MSVPACKMPTSNGIRPPLRKKGITLVEPFSNKGPLLNSELSTIASFVKALKKYPQNNTRAYEYGNTFHLIKGQLCQKIQHITCLFISLSSKSRPKFSRIDQEKNGDIIEQANDLLIDRANASMDIILGLRDPDEIAYHRPIHYKPRIKRFAAIPMDICKIKPQDEYKEIAATKKLTTSMNDKGDEVFTPLITKKSNGINKFKLTPIYDKGVITEYQNPYSEEISAFNPSQFCYRQPEDAVPLPADPADAIMVDNVEKFEQLFNHLKQVPIFAVDVEHNSYRSYHGLTCLIQITTKTGGDYVLDVFKLWTKIPKLNEIFTDPNKVKVFHGAHQDIRWLQRDFGIYVVGLFDTFEAAKLLSHRTLSLAYLIFHYCGILVDKKHAEFDWRYRPLPEDVIKYAISDTHYLLYIYSVMANELITKTNERNLFELVFNNSKHTAAMVYHPPSNPKAIFNRIIPSNLSELDKLRMMQLIVWRQDMAYKLDESPTYICSTVNLVRLVRTLPKETHDVIRCLCGIDKTHPIMNKDVIEEIHSIIHLKTDKYKWTLELRTTFLCNYAINPYVFNQHDNTFIKGENTIRDLPTLLAANSCPEDDWSEGQSSSIMSTFLASHKIVEVGPSLGEERSGIILTPYERLTKYNAIAGILKRKKNKVCDHEESPLKLRKM